jgi:hypothetical protein
LSGGPPPVDPVTFESAAITTNTGFPLSVPLNMPAGIDPGDSLVASVAVATAGVVITMAGWVPFHGPLFGAFMSQRSFWKVAAGGDTGTAVFDNNANMSAVVARFANSDPVTPVDVAGDSGPTIGGDPTCPSVVTVTDQCMIVRVVHCNVAGTLTAPAGATQRADANSGGTDTQSGLATEDALVAPGVVGADVYGTDQFTEWVAETIAIRP